MNKVLLPYKKNLLSNFNDISGTTFSASFVKSLKSA